MTGPNTQPRRGIVLQFPSLLPDSEVLLGAVRDLRLVLEGLVREGREGRARTLVGWGEFLSGELGGRLAAPELAGFCHAAIPGCFKPAGGSRQLRARARGPAVDLSGACLEMEAKLARRPAPPPRNLDIPGPLVGPLSLFAGLFDYPSRLHPGILRECPAGHPLHGGVLRYLLRRGKTRLLLEGLQEGLVDHGELGRAALESGDARTISTLSSVAYLVGSGELAGALANQSPGEAQAGAGGLVPPPFDDLWCAPDAGGKPGGSGV
ncbi:MAG: hypothetical protein ACTSU5_21505 [Promethearchaeota archaeon]